MIFAVHKHAANKGKIELKPLKLKDFFGPKGDEVLAL